MPKTDKGKTMALDAMDGPSDTNKYKAWCWTFFPEGDEPADPKDVPQPEWNERMHGKVAYMCMGLERCPKTSKLHWQGYVRFTNRQTFKAAKRLFLSDKVHVERCRGTEKENHEYCCKDGKVWVEEGTYEPEAGHQGHRSDLVDIAVSLQRGDSMKDVAEAHPASFMRYHGGIQAYAEITLPPPPRERPMATIVLWGETGTGKTHRVLHKPEWENLFTVAPGRDCWDGYTDQKQVFFDEFDDKLWSIQAMNRYCDKWLCRLDARYKNRWARWDLVIICSNSPPKSWWPNEDLPLVKAFRRRIEPPMGLVIEVTSREQDVWAQVEQELADGRFGPQPAASQASQTDQMIVIDEPPAAPPAPVPLPVPVPTQSATVPQGYTPPVRQMSPIIIHVESDSE